MCKLVQSICDGVVCEGCDLDVIKIFMGLMVVIGCIDEEVQECFCEYVSYVSFEVGFVYFLVGIGIDFLKYELDELICVVKINVIELLIKVVM